MSDFHKSIETLVGKAAEATNSEDALRFSEAALNIAQIKHALLNIPELTFELGNQEDGTATHN